MYFEYSVFFPTFSMQISICWNEIGTHSNRWKVSERVKKWPKLAQTQGIVFWIGASYGSGFVEKQSVVKFWNAG